MNTFVVGAGLQQGFVEIIVNLWVHLGYKLQYKEFNNVKYV